MKNVCPAKYNQLMQQRYNIICLSNQLWDTTSPTNKHHVMYRLAKLGHNVLFVDPPINTGRVFIKQWQYGWWSAKRLLTQTKVDESGILVYTPLNVVPVSHITSLLHISKINALAKKHLDPNLKTILWVYHVQIASLQNYLAKINHDILIYDCVDNYETFAPGNKLYGTSAGNVAAQEELLARTADLVFTVTPMLVEKLSKYNPKVYWTPNAGDFELFKDSKKYKFQLPKDVEGITRPRIGYIGALDDYKFDVGLVKRLALDYPNYSFVLVGPLALKSENASLKDLGLADLKNVFYLGPKPYSLKKYYLAGFDAEIIPFQLNDYTINSYPVKFHDSLAAGLPVITTNLPAFSPFKEVAYVSKNHDEFSRNLKLALEEDSPARMKRRQEVAKLNSWDAKVEKMLGYINTASALRV